MARASVHSEKARLSNIRKLAPSPDELLQQSHFARYYCVLVCGLVEKCVKLIVNDFAKDGCRPEVMRYVERKMHRYSEVHPDDLEKLVTAFNPDWGVEFANYANGEISDAMISVVAIRHSIAHGESQGVSLGTMDRYYAQVEKLVDWLDGRFA